MIPHADTRREAATIDHLREAATRCQRCALYAHATQTVFGEGAAPCQVMMVGEQPGDQEDLAGKPFVGPAGNLLDQALKAAGIDRTSLYVTNAVKHFKWEPRGKRRLHKKPGEREIAACYDWLADEIEVVKPTCIVCLGATAARAVIGKDFRVTRDRGRFIDNPLAPFVFGTIHPSAILRTIDEHERQLAFDALVSDFGLVRSALDQAARPSGGT